MGLRLEVLELEAGLGIYEWCFGWRCAGYWLLMKVGCCSS
jgi:hypothetical protein